MRPTFLLLAPVVVACLAPAPPTGDTDLGHTDLVDSDVADSEPADSEAVDDTVIPVDTDLGDTDVVDSEPADSDPPDTELPPDTFVPDPDATWTLDTATSPVDTDPADAPPSIRAVFPPDFAGVEATTTVYVQAVDDVGVASVTVAGVPAGWDDRGFWVARGVPSDRPVVEVRDTAGQAATATLGLRASAPFVWPSELAAADDGAMVGFDPARQVVVRLDVDATPRATLISGPGLGVGPLPAEVGEEVLAVDARAGDEILLLIADAPAHTATALAVDPGTGDRRIDHACSWPGWVVPVAVADDPASFYAVDQGDVLWRCDRGSTAPVAVATMGFTVPGSVRAAAWDPASGRLFLGDAQQGEVRAVRLPDGTVEPIVAPLPRAATDGGAVALAVDDGRLFVGTYSYGAYVLDLKTFASGGVSGLGGWTPGSLAPCRVDGARALCLAFSPLRGPDPLVHTYAETDAGWLEGRLDDARVGAGATTPRGAWAAAVQVPGRGPLDLDLRVTDAWGTLHRLDGVTGARAVLATGAGSALGTPLASGTTLLTGYLDARTFDVRDPSAAPAPVPGPRTTNGTTWPGYALLPAGTRAPGEALAIVGATGVRVRPLATGRDLGLVTGLPDAQGVEGGEDGALYVSHRDHVGVIRAGASTEEVLVPTTWYPRLSYDRRTRTLAVASAHGVLRVDVDTGATQALDLRAVDLPMDGWDWALALSGLHPGPFPDSVVGVAHYGVVLVDLRNGAVFVLGR